MFDDTPPSHSKVLVAVIVLAAIAFGIRFGGVTERVVRGDYTVQPDAQSTESLNAVDTAAGDQAPPPSEKTLEKVDAAKNKDTSAPAEDKGKAASADKGTSGDWKGADDLDDQYADVKMEMFADLSKRRKDLEIKEKELVMREALLKATQDELDQKTKELSKVKTDIEALLKQQTDQENQRIASLVKIYEGMKPKDAARIFDTLDMDILLQVITKMSERKSALVIASMDPERAKNLTILMAEQNKIPEVPSLSNLQ